MENDICYSLGFCGISEDAVENEDEVIVLWIWKRRDFSGSHYTDDIKTGFISGPEKWSGWKSALSSERDDASSWKRNTKVYEIIPNSSLQLFSEKEFMVSKVSLDADFVNRGVD